MKIVWHSNAPWAPTGYGQQTALFAPRIRDLGHDLAISAYWGLGGAIQTWQDIPVYPADEQWGNVYLPSIAKHWGGKDGPALVIALTDMWVLKSPELQNLNIAGWVPVDHDPVPPDVAAFFESGGPRPIAMSRFGQKTLQDRGLDARYVPHGIDTDVFQPKPDSRPGLRDLLQIPEDAFVVGMVAANKCPLSRKGFSQTLQAFAGFLETHDDAYLYLHTDLLGRHGGQNLLPLVEALDIPGDRVKHTPAWLFEMGVQPDDLAALYSVMDVVANPSFGEGFGIPIIEAQACGLPVIVTDWTAMTELCGAGWLVDGDRWWDATQRSWFKAPAVADIQDAIEQAYELRGSEEIARKARAFAVQYDADRVLHEYWVPVLGELVSDGPEMVPEEPVVFTRDQKRLAA